MRSTAMKWLPVWLLFILCGCSAPVVHIDTPSVSERFQEAAQAREAAGDYQGAVDYYLRAAAVASGKQRAGILLQAAGSLVQAAEYDRATALLDRLADTQLSNTQRQRFVTLRAGIALARNDADAVLRLLQSVPADASLKVDYYRYRAEAWQRKGNFIASTQERLLLDPLLYGSEQRLTNHVAIWMALNRLTAADLQQLHTAPPPDPLSGWIELVELARLNRDGADALAAAILQWQLRYPGHPASEGFTGKLASGMRIAGQPPQQLALLLPLSGTLANAGAAIRDGLLAAYYNMPGDARRPSIKIHDVGGNPETIMDAYRQAVSEGAQFIIGPLRKEAVQLLALQQFPIPVLALNRVGADTPINPLLFQFGLAPEDEAREVARRAWHDGHKRAIALVPAGIWGDRVYQAFLEEWQQLGGQLLDMEHYDPEEPDHGQQIRSVLNLDGSRQRHQRLVRLLGHDLAFEPRRRKDLDFIFLLASPGQGRLIRPQLEFYRAAKIPVYATSHVYTGHPDNALDSDMDGLLFCDIPWILDPGWGKLQTLAMSIWPDEIVNYSRFFALGFDALRVIPYLDRAGDDSRGTYVGATGKLTLDASQRIHRNLRWARFQNGLPDLLEAGADILEDRDVMSANNSESLDRGLR
jgi:outer membrane PBP1 activator LpoA protein